MNTITLKELLKLIKKGKQPKTIYIDIQNCNKNREFIYKEEYGDYRCFNENTNPSMSEGCLWLKEWIKYQQNNASEQKFLDKTKVYIKEEE